MSYNLSAYENNIVVAFTSFVVIFTSNQIISLWFSTI